MNNFFLFVVVDAACGVVTRALVVKKTGQGRLEDTKNLFRVISYDEYDGHHIPLLRNHISTLLSTSNIRNVLNYIKYRLNFTQMTQRRRGIQLQPWQLIWSMQQHSTMISVVMKQ